MARLNTADTVRLGPLGKASLEEGRALAIRTFLPFMDETGIRAELEDTDPGLSLALRIGDRVVGVFLVSDRPLPNGDFDDPLLKGRYGLCGDALAVEPEFRGKGYGRLLRAALPALCARTHGEYVWCMELKSLNNLDCWLSRHFLLTSTESVHITVEPVAGDLRAALKSRAPAAHWASGENPGRASITGLLVMEDRWKAAPVMKDKVATVVPWVVGKDRAVALPGVTPGDRSQAALEGTTVEVTGDLSGERMENVSSIVACEAPGPRVSR